MTRLKHPVVAALAKILMVVSLALWAIAGRADTGAALLEQMNNYPHARSIASSDANVRDYEIGLGAMEKVGGVWKLKRSERHSGVLQRRTWQVTDGFTSLEILESLEASLALDASAELLFSCGGRSCGQGVQWANRVFKERILYGREDMQRYRVYTVGNPATHRVLLYSAARSADRQYLHLELLTIAN